MYIMGFTQMSVERLRMLHSSSASYAKLCLCSMQPYDCIIFHLLYYHNPSNIHNVNYYGVQSKVLVSRQCEASDP